MKVVACVHTFFGMLYVYIVAFSLLETYIRKEGTIESRVSPPHRFKRLVETLGLPLTERRPYLVPSISTY